MIPELTKRCLNNRNGVLSGVEGSKVALSNTVALTGKSGNIIFIISNLFIQKSRHKTGKYSILSLLLYKEEVLLK